MERVENKAVITDSLYTANDGITTRRDSTLEVHTMAAVFYQPDSTELDSIKKANGENFAVIVDEAKRNQAKAIEFLKAKHIKTFVTDKAYLQFVKNGGDIYVYQHKKLKHQWGILLYDRQNPPNDADMSMIEYDYLQYFVK